jgi:hypothetical protein
MRRLFRRYLITTAASIAVMPLLALPCAGQPAATWVPPAFASLPGCSVWAYPELPRDPTEPELRCRYGVHGPGRFGLSLYMEVPVYQPATPLPGTHVVGVPGMPRPLPGESYEAWEWRVLRTDFGHWARHVVRDLDVLDPIFAARLLEFEERLRAAGVRFTRRETWRSAERQAYLFQQGRSRPGPLVTATLTSWHSLVDSRGTPSAKAADYNVPRSHMARFHEIAWDSGLESYGPDSNDPGHVYLAGAEAFPSAELIFLRLLPRVPVVTLSTGRPMDETVTREQRAEYRLASYAFAWEPFFPHAEPRLAGARPLFGVREDPIDGPGLPAFEVREQPWNALAAVVRWVSKRR